MSKGPVNPGRVVIANAAQATGETLGDYQLVTAVGSSRIKGSLKHAAKGVEDAFEE
ncbi:MAG: hypothetical protein ACYC1I_11790 [Acidimicrobiales bacterium]